jgi:hypothetical protein
MEIVSAIIQTVPIIPAAWKSATTELTMTLQVQYCSVAGKCGGSLLNDVSKLAMFKNTSSKATPGPTVNAYLWYPQALVGEVLY